MNYTAGGTARVTLADHPGPPPVFTYKKCSHDRLRFVWRIFKGKNQPKRYGFQCLDCGESGYKWHNGAMTSQWVAERNSVEYFDRNPDEAVSYHDKITDWLLDARREFFATRREQRIERKNDWWDWYNRYLKSEAWQRKRQEVFARDNNKCLACGAPAEQVHHIRYDSVGYEPLDDLASVCEACHLHIHGR